MKKFFTFFLFLLCFECSFAAYTENNEQFKIQPDDTQCSTAAFANGLSSNINQVSETDSETTIKQWIYQVFKDKNVLQAVLSCPEFSNIADDETVKFLPITYTFPGGREIVINYETQPKILKQRLSLSGKRDITANNNPSPEIGNPDDTAIWTNTDPAWYAIMVVEADSLDEFVGPDKNNTISIKWINDNIDKIYPKGASCTSKSALANDNDIINLAVRETVNIEDDSNDYYVAGDVSLEWIGYLEIGLDVAITVLTVGTGTAILGTTKAVRASKTLKNLSTSLKQLTKLDSVQNYMKVAQQYKRATEELKTIDKVKDAAGYARKETEIKNLAQNMKNLEQADDNVRKYKQASDTFTSLNQYRRNLRLLRPAQRGNIIARTWRAFKAANTGGKALTRGARVARSSMKSGKIRDWLFQSTLSNIGVIGKLQETGGILYGALTFLGDMYDITDTSTSEYTNNIEFKPLTLLSADDLAGQENVVNYGMWLMWLGDSFSAEDDDAAYLQAMDFANKFHFSLEQVQEEQGTNACNVDIYVVRPVLRNPNDEKNSEIYYLIMNDVPWTTKE